MEIRILGKQTIYIKGKKEGVWIDPNEDVKKSSKVSARICVYTLEDFVSEDLSSSNVIIKGQGEYEVGGIEVVGLNGGEGRTVYVINVDGIIVGVLGELSEPLSDKKIGKIDSVDVLLTSVKSRENISNKMILEWAKKWGVNYLVPMADNEADLKKFLDVADQEGLEPVESLVVDKDNLPDGLEIKILKQN